VLYIYIYIYVCPCVHSNSLKMHMYVCMFIPKKNSFGNVIEFISSIRLFCLFAFTNVLNISCFSAAVDCCLLQYKIYYWLSLPAVIDKCVLHSLINVQYY
jgi:hypothetical protein